jgi:hypothetical protein
MANFTGNTEFFEIIKQINKIGREIIKKEKNIIEIKKAYGIEDSDIDKNYHYQKEDGLTEEE